MENAHHKLLRNATKYLLQAHKYHNKNLIFCGENEKTYEICFSGNPFTLLVIPKEIHMEKVRDMTSVTGTLRNTAYKH